MQYTTVISTAKDAAKRLLVKVRRYGKDDVQTPTQAAPYGIDSNPIAGMKAIYSPTTESGKNVIIGYINKDHLSDVGEVRLFSTDSNGALKTYVWLKKNGDIQLGGNTDNLVKYTPLNTSMEQLQLFITQQLALIATGIATGGGSYTPGVLDIDISGSKVDKVKV